jgi:phosphatidylethanolamine/phosphatidyl-N-methylethanolamine N-methyltransferase
MLKENIVFIREFLTEFKTTGACFPTSRWAAQALIAPLTRAGRKPVHILELGPGTGSVTIPILVNMRPGDSLTICEINPRFMKTLKERLEDLPEFQRVKAQVTFFEGPAQSISETIKFDIIVCALPFLNFDLKTVQEIFNKLRRISTPDTLMTYYEYIGLRKMGQTVSYPERRRRINEVASFMEQRLPERLGRERIWLNLLPINVYTIRPAA